MRIRTATAATAILAAALVGCTDTDDSSSSTAKPPTISSTASALSPEQRASIREAAGLPPTPNPADWAAYIKVLTGLDPDIVHGKEDKAISRGIDTCSAIKRYPDDTAKQAEQAGRRFTSPDHPEGRDQATAKRILAAAHTYICPTY
ncbi:hypothetical protein OIA45_39690 [Streptomyces chartreusis]|uniref:hypothetical protein n=1 Tax=Streptomyces chartreusis TaxID=1969 RepID=UPI0038695D4D|nr:hypothetical protein OIA45_39690 [Streptomyces chartreusis]